MNNKSNLVFVLLMFLLPACSLEAVDARKGQTAQPMPTVAVITKIVPPDLYPSPTPVICTSLAPGMTLSANPVSPTSVRIEITGLQVGENVILILRSQSNGYTYQIEGHPVTPADPNGYYSEIVNSLSPKMKHWTVQVIHSRGVACTEVDLP